MTYMRALFMGLLVGMFWLWGLGGPAALGQVPADDALRRKVEAVAPRLLSEELDLRRQAWEELLKLGTGARGALKAAAVAADGPLRERLQALLRELDIRSAVDDSLERLFDATARERDAARQKLHEL
ncbi:hypothetical protein JYT83_01080, partial [bacterium AH-315-F18]|nr:hypothetical protein [bacterium AH-315-F18]